MLLRRMMIVGVVALLAGLTALPVQGAPAAPVWPAPTLGGVEPIVIGHRGAPAYRPEHTLASYRLAIAQGADVIEPDLVSTKDHVLVVRHENDITSTTDVAQHPEFADRRATKVVDGQAMTGWFVEDFTFAELQTLRAIERLPDVRPANTAMDGLYRIPTFQQVIDLARAHGVGIEPETKHPTYFRSLGLPLEEPLVAALKRNGLNRRDAPVFIQSFEVGNLKRMRSMTPVRLLQLVEATGSPADLVAAGSSRTYADMITPRGLRAIARYADGVGPDKNLIIPRIAATDALGAPTTLVADAHRAGLFVHAWTFRPENGFLPANLRPGRPAAENYLEVHGGEVSEIRRFLRLGVDGVFTDNAEAAVAARVLLTRGR